MLPKSPRSPDPENAGTGEAAEPAPRWVWTLGLVGVALVILFVVAHLASGGFHGHSLANDAGQQTGERP
jgi:hypothetical protein